jgi:hypothetical protein
LLQYLFRFLVGGTIVSLFACLGDLLKPKSFAGLFGAAPSVALATLGLTIVADGKAYAALARACHPELAPLEKTPLPLAFFLERSHPLFDSPLRFLRSSRTQYAICLAAQIMVVHEKFFQLVHELIPQIIDVLYIRKNCGCPFQSPQPGRCVPALFSFLARPR